MPHANFITNIYKKPDQHAAAIQFFRQYSGQNKLMNQALVIPRIQDFGWDQSRYYLNLSELPILKAKPSLTSLLEAGRWLEQKNYKLTGYTKQISKQQWWEQHCQRFKDIELTALKQLHSKLATKLPQQKLRFGVNQCKIAQLEGGNLAVTNVTDINYALVGTLEAQILIDNRETPEPNPENSVWWAYQFRYLQIAMLEYLQTRNLSAELTKRITNFANHD